jgi:branched-chain amino acid transport system ATP-binding protein
MSSLLEVDSLRVFYRNVEGLHRASLRIEQASIVAVIGPNGAGKSTLLGAIMGLLSYKGHIRFQGEPIDAVEVEARVSRGMSLVPERRELFAEMTVEENLSLGAFPWCRRHFRLSGDLDAVYSRFPRLKERRTQFAGTLSGGERQMLAIGRALMSRPRLVMLDEPSLGLAPMITVEMFRAITDLRASGVSVLLVEQNARAALRIADYAYVLETGEIVLEGQADDIASDPRVIASYLGMRGEGSPRPMVGDTL